MMYRIAENFRGRKLSRIGKKNDFRRENFRGSLLFAVSKDTMPWNFAGKTFTNSHKIMKFAKVLSLKSFPLYGNCYRLATRCFASSNYQAIGNKSVVTHALVCNHFKHCTPLCFVLISMYILPNKYIYHVMCKKCNRKLARGEPKSRD